MSDNSTVRMLQAVELVAPAPMFLSSFFKVRPENIHTSEKVEMDIIREDEDIAVPVPHVSTDARNNESNKYVNKAYLPAVLKEQGPINAFETMQRQPGQDPFEDPNYAAAAGRGALALIRKLLNKCKRTVELMGAQVLQTGKISLLNEAGVEIFGEDFLAKATHLITVGTVWAADGSTGDPLADISAAGRVVRKDGKRKPDRLLFGNSALQRFLANAKVKAALDKTTLNLANLNPSARSEDATFYGMIWIDNYQYEIWLYDAFYKHPQTGVLTPYIADDKVIMVSSQARLDLTFGKVPFFVPPDSRAANFLGERMTSVDAGFDFTPNAWIKHDNSGLFVSVNTRPLAIPTEIDSFACLDVVP